MTSYEFNAAVVSAGSTDLGYELLQREVGARKWKVVGHTQDTKKAQKWAARSGYRIRKLRGF